MKESHAQANCLSRRENVETRNFALHTRESLQQQLMPFITEIIVTEQLGKNKTFSLYPQSPNFAISSAYQIMNFTVPQTSPQLAPNLAAQLNLKKIWSTHADSAP